MDSQFWCDACLKLYFTNELEPGKTLETCEACRLEKRCTLIPFRELTPDPLVIQAAVAADMPVQEWIQKWAEDRMFTHAVTWAPAIVRLEFASASIDWCVRSALRFCERSRCQAVFRFNGIDVHVSGACTESNVQWIVETFRKSIESVL